MAKHIMKSGTLTKNAQCQLVTSAMYPPMMGPIPDPMAKRELIMPSIFPLLWESYRSPTAAVDTGIIIPPPNPCRALLNRNSSMELERPARREPRRNIPHPIRNNGLLPYLSDSFPAMGMVIVSHSM